jgi:hypothetical protein
VTPDTNKCWICDWPAKILGGGEKARVKCPRCGEYLITGTLSHCRFPLPDADRHRMSAWMRQRALDGRELLLLDSYMIEAVASQLPSPKPHQRGDLLLVSLSKAFPVPGQCLEVNWINDYPLACGSNRYEGEFHFQALRAAGHIQANSHPTTGAVELTISRLGWEKIDQLSSTQVASKVAFIAMSFSKEVLDVAEPPISAAVRKAGFEPELSNRPEHNEQIDARIIAGIKRASFVVADVTGAKTGVYFEAGYALGLGRPVIWTCRRTSQADMHFDTRQYNHILWGGPEDLEQQLYYRIAATI